MSRRAATLLTSSGLALVLGVVGAFVEVPYLGLAPGEVRNTLGTNRNGKQIIRISDPSREHRDGGPLDFTTILVAGGPDHGIRLGDALRYWLDGESAVVPRELYYPVQKSSDEAERRASEEMTQSQNSAKTAALAELGIPRTTTLVVDEVSDGSPASKVLRKDDVLVAVDGRPISGAESLRAAIGTRRPGQPVRVTYRRAGRTATATVGTFTSTDGENRAAIGITVREEYEYPFEVTVETENVGGPSAGLMFALGIIELLTPGSLTEGVHVAGTGTIDDSGNVGPIGGIQQKLAGAKAAGATVFLVPAGNWEDAVEAKPEGLELYRVATLKEALSALEKIRAGR